jgi:pyrroline-5-carboxylate reductase
VTNLGAVNRKPAGARLGILGAGRLGGAIARVWRTRTGEAPLVWSRGGQRPPPADDDRRAAEVAWAADWAGVLEARSVVVAIPGRAMLDLAAESDAARAFGGNVFSAAASLSRESLLRVFPRATVVCIAPFLIDEPRSIPLLALRPSELPPPDWERAAAELRQLGDVDVVEDEAVFAQISLLGAPWPVVVLAAIGAAARAGVRGVEDETAVGIGQRLFFRALRSLLSTRLTDGAGPGEDVATPGGITERGLNQMEALSDPLASVFEQMRARADELRV